MVKFDKVERLLTKLGKTKVDLIKELAELNDWIEKTDHANLEGISLKRMFYVKQDIENRIEDVNAHAEYLGCKLSESDVMKIVERFLGKYDCTIDEDTQITYLIENFMKRKRN